MQTMFIDEFHDMMKLQGFATPPECRFRCPQCGTIQGVKELIAAGAGETQADVMKFLAFSCIGRFPVAAKQGFGCDWTLGGLLQIHELEVIDRDGIICPRFMPATRAELSKLPKLKASE